ncbi:4'-phosphopantetheinyl transferase family protein [Streptacidiphilus carbonis]|jgi:4'-phosphopantetheinyl transferase|uniref:4'-phosphopantetheinyl transferase family protein n=1 Tax=Streptacidiphilus carbonis TaxID=105422 RepID=UPI0007C7B4E7|nr:4'-phosphopantetheinyl transferase superfamily protein [Streptacidiphilus carbonis]
MDAVRVWLGWADGSAAGGDADRSFTDRAAVLDPEERARAAAFARPGLRNRYTAAHVMLRQVLGECLGLDPALVCFDRDACPCCGGPHGRPVLAGEQRSLEFSLSHAGALVAIAVAAAPVGVDVETLPGPGTVADVASALHPAERAEIAAAADPAVAFARLWTRKEAYLKGLGTGLGRGLDLDYVGSEQPGPPDWAMADLPAPDGHAVAVAVRQPEPVVAGLTWLTPEAEPATRHDQD